MKRAHRPSRTQEADTERWSKRWSKCTRCRKTDQPHAARGLCRRCYQRLRHRKVGTTIIRLNQAPILYLAALDEAAHDAGMPKTKAWQMVLGPPMRPPTNMEAKAFLLARDDWRDLWVRDLQRRIAVGQVALLRIEEDLPTTNTGILLPVEYRDVLRDAADPIGMNLGTAAWLALAAAAVNDFVILESEPHDPA